VEGTTRGLLATCSTLIAGSCSSALGAATSITIVDETMMIPEHFRPELLRSELRKGWREWALDFFTEEDVAQSPYVDITLQLDVTAAYAWYRNQGVEGASFFAFLLWHLAQTLMRHPDFNLRRVDGEWYQLHNPPIFVPVAVGGSIRFQEMVLEDVYQRDYTDFIAYYADALRRAREGRTSHEETSRYFYLGHLIGNLPTLQFSALTLHWRAGIAGHTAFYFGKRYWVGEKLTIPFAAKLHHACTDPFTLDLLLQDFLSWF
jgi:chloramphenicol O-acetyltransferase type A